MNNIKLKKYILSGTKIISSKSQSLSAGFTIVELITTLAIFSIMVLAVANIIVRVLELQRRITNTQQIQENAIFIIESMAKEIRVSEIDSNACGGGTTCTVSNLSMTHPVNGAVSYRLSGTDIIRNARGEDDTPPSTTYDSIINSAKEVNFTRLNFVINGLSIDCMQPRITIVTGLENKVGQILHVDLQTTVISRDISIESASPLAGCP